MNPINAMVNVRRYLDRRKIDYTGIGYPQPNGEDWRVAVDIVYRDTNITETFLTYLDVNSAKGSVDGSEMRRQLRQLQV